MTDAVSALASFLHGYGQNTTGFAFISENIFTAVIITSKSKVKGIALYDNRDDLDTDRKKCGTCYDSSRVWFTKKE